MRDPIFRPRTLAPPPLVYAAVLYAAWWLQQRQALGFDMGAAGSFLGWALIG